MLGAIKVGTCTARIVSRTLNIVLPKAARSVPLAVGEFFGVALVWVLVWLAFSELRENFETCRDSHAATAPVAVTEKFADAAWPALAVAALPAR